MRIARWHPLDEELESLRHRVDQLWEDNFSRLSRLPSPFWENIPDVPIDMYQTPTAVVVKAGLPGIEPDDVDISVSGDILTIKGEQHEKENIDQANYLYREHISGSLSRSVKLPGDLQIDRAEADFDNGVLTLTIPKAEETSPKVIKIRTSGKK